MNTILRKPEPATGPSRGDVARTLPCARWGLGELVYESIRERGRSAEVKCALALLLCPSSPRASAGGGTPKPPVAVDSDDPAYVVPFVSISSIMDLCIHFSYHSKNDVRSARTE